MFTSSVFIPIAPGGSSPSQVSFSFGIVAFCNKQGILHQDKYPSSPIVLSFLGRLGMLTLENKARETIDQALGNSGGKIRGTRSVNPHVSIGVASRNLSTISGHTLIDLIYAARKPAGTIEVTKRVGTKAGAEVQPADWEPYKIATEVERRLSVIEELEATVEANLTRTERMRQSILSQAFSGRLLTQGSRGISDAVSTSLWQLKTKQGMAEVVVQGGGELGS